MFSLISASSLTLMLPFVALYQVACPLLLETVSNKLSFQWHWSLDLLAFDYSVWSYLNNDKTYILKY
jgi:hypothetical protein